jgi:asparagine N-glycosylation enzyme membrane subunit Stt3
MVVIPVFLSRTLAGIPEKESAGFLFMFLSFYLFLKAWRSETIKKAAIFAVLAGITTVLMRLIWGGVLYVFLTIAIASLIAFLLNKMHKKEFIVYSIWFWVSFLMTIIILSSKFSIKAILSSIIQSAPLLVFLIFLTHLIVWGTGVSRFFNKTKLPKNIISIIIAFILILFASSIIFGPSFIINQVENIHQLIFRPTAGRWSTTVAESRQPFFTEWGSNFGPFFKNIPVLFWLFFIGSVVLFKNMLNKLKSKDSWILTGTYFIFLIGMIFSRYSESSTFNGSNFISKSLYYLSVILLLSCLIYYYIKYSKRGDKGFEQIDYRILFLLIIFILGIFGSRSAIRLIMVLAPITTIFVGYLIVVSIDKFKKTDDEIAKIILGVLIVLILLSSIFVFWTFYKSIKSQAYSMVPSAYNQQWQKAMEWVREETPKTAVFGHWWDYGYWLQSIGERATVLDGGNRIGYWNYLMGRHVLTGDNQNDALEFLYNHNTTHLLIDSSDIGKYGAYSSIASNEDYDRASGIGTFLLDETQTQETQNQIMIVYTGGVGLDEDLIINEDGKEILLPAGNSGVGAIILPIKNTGDPKDISKAEQPYIVVIYQGLQHKVNLRYLYGNGELIDFGSGIEAGVFVFPRLLSEARGLSSNPIGAAMFISPRLMRGMFSQVYLLDDSLNNFPNFKLVHSEPNFIVNDLRNQGLDLPEIIYYSGIQGPIKIWEIEYTGNEQIKEEYLDIDASKYLTWQL